MVSERLIRRVIGISLLIFTFLPHSFFHVDMLHQLAHRMFKNELLISQNPLSLRFQNRQEAKAMLDLNGDKKVLSEKEGVKNYVALATTIMGNFARSEDYDFLAALTASNWMAHGFIPILVLVYPQGKSDENRIEEIKRLYQLVLPDEAKLVGLPVPPGLEPISVAQMVRLWIPHLVPELHLDSWLRITDADMWIADARPFANANSSADIVDVYNGNCCRGGQPTLLSDGRSCHQYPIHSVGMRVGLWLKLFPVTSSEAEEGTPTTSTSLVGTDEVLSAISRAFSLFPYWKPNAQIRHGRGSQWYMDQILLGCQVDGAAKNGIVHAITTGPMQRRLHIPSTRLKKVVDLHLARFRLDDHDAWLLELVGLDSNLLNKINISKLETYMASWKEFKKHQTVTY